MDAKTFWHLNSHKYNTIWIANSNDDKIIFEKSDDLWRFMNDFIKQAGINTNVVRPTSDLSDGGELLQGEAEGKGVSVGIECEHPYYSVYGDLDTCLKCGKVLGG